MKTPVIARFLLTLAAGADALYVTGDLEEEFRGLCESCDLKAARQWYRRQTRASLGPLLAIRLRKQELPVDGLTALLTGTLPLLALDRFWCVVYSLIPLRDGTAREPWMFCIDLAVLLLCTALQPAAGTFVRMAAVALALCGSTATQPVWYVCGALAIAPAVWCLQEAQRRTA